MSRSRWLLFSIPLLVFLAGLPFLFSAIGSDPTVLPSTRIDQSFPAFTLATLENPQQMITEAAIKGPLLVNVWATWCPTCQVEHPLLVQLSQQGIRMVGLNYKDEPNAARQYLKIHGNPFEWTISDVKGDLGLDLGVYGAPETYLIDADGKIRMRYVGAITPNVWRETLWPKWQEMGGSHGDSARPAEGASS